MKKVGLQFSLLINQDSKETQLRTLQANLHPNKSEYSHLEWSWVSQKAFRIAKAITNIRGERVCTRWKHFLKPGSTKVQLPHSTQFYILSRALPPNHDDHQHQHHYETWLTLIPLTFKSHLSWRDEINIPGKIITSFPSLFSSPSHSCWKQPPQIELFTSEYQQILPYIWYMIYMTYLHISNSNTNPLRIIRPERNTVQRRHPKNTFYYDLLLNSTHHPPTPRI